MRNPAAGGRSPLHRRCLLVIALATAIITVTGAAQADTFDVQSNFSPDSNPNGVWTYGFSSSLTPGQVPELVLYDQSGTTPEGIQFWRSTIVQVLGAPANSNNPTDNQISIVPPHTAYFHPGPNGEFSIYRFTAPNDGDYSLDATFGGIDVGGTDVHILYNGTELFTANITGGSTSSFSTALSLAAGDVIDFAVGVGLDGNFFSDSTSISATLTSATPG